MIVFWLVFVGVTIWQFLPEYVFPFLQSLAFLCWVAPKNEVANFIGGGMGGMGFLNLSLDWSNISAFNDMGSKLTNSHTFWFYLATPQSRASFLIQHLEDIVHL
jgi:hypothetical protein